MYGSLDMSICLLSLHSVTTQHMICCKATYLFSPMDCCHFLTYFIMRWGCERILQCNPNWNMYWLSSTNFMGRIIWPRFLHFLMITQFTDTYGMRRKALKGIKCRCPIIFEGHPSIQFQGHTDQTRSPGQLQLSNHPDLPCSSVQHVNHIHVCSFLINFLYIAGRGWIV